MLSNATKISCKWFEWVEDISKFNKDFIKSYSKRSNEGYLLKFDAQYPKNLDEIHNDLPFLPKIKKN